jgi:hypothetical protein
MVPIADALFIDTSIAISRYTGGRRATKLIESRRDQHTVVGGLVGRQEFRRRLIGDAIYLYKLVREEGIESATRQLGRLAGMPHQKRKVSICLALMADINGATETDRSDALCAKLNFLITAGLGWYEKWLDVFRRDSGCGCAVNNVSKKTTKAGTVDFSVKPIRCSKLPEGNCTVSHFLASMAGEREAIRRELARIQIEEPQRLTSELDKAAKFLDVLEDGSTSPESCEPCLKHGDLLIALESVAAKCRSFYTLNRRESEHLCRALGQVLIVHPADSSRPEEVIPPSAPK